MITAFALLIISIPFGVFWLMARHNVRHYSRPPRYHHYTRSDFRPPSDYNDW